MKTNVFNVSGMDELSLNECSKIVGGETTTKCITGPNGETIRVTRTVDSNGNVTITAVNDIFCRIGGAK